MSFVLALNLKGFDFSLLFKFVTVKVIRHSEKVNFGI